MGMDFGSVPIFIACTCKSLHMCYTDVDFDRKEEHTMKHKRSPIFKFIMSSTILFLVLVVIFVVFMLKQSLYIRQFNNDLWVLQNETTICIAEHHGSKVKLSNDNIYGIGTVTPYLTRVAYKGAEVIKDEFLCTYTCHDVDWVFHVCLLEDSIIKVTLDGTNHYVFYFENDTAYDKFLTFISAEGWQSPNKVFIPEQY